LLLQLVCVLSELCRAPQAEGDLRSSQQREQGLRQELGAKDKALKEQAIKISRVSTGRPCSPRVGLNRLVATAIRGRPSGAVQGHGI
jgi:hypothetical protein